MRVVRAVVVALGLLGCGGEELEPVDAVARIGQEIVGGVEARPGSHPWIVSLQSNGSHFCGGSIVKGLRTGQSDIVVTAAHCVYDGTSGLVVVAGAHNFSRPTASTTVHRAAKVVYHPAYDPDTTRNDIAVIQLATPIKFTSAVQPVALPAAGEVVPDNSLGTVAGWGLTREGGYDTSNILMQVSVPTINSRELIRMYASQGIEIFPAEMLGAGYAQGGKDSCQGDSGGPFVFKNASGGYVLQGIVSFGVGCARAGSPGVYARVSNYIPWLNQQIRLLSQ